MRRYIHDGTRRWRGCNKSVSAALLEVSSMTIAKEQRKYEPNSFHPQTNFTSEDTSICIINQIYIPLIPRKVIRYARFCIFKMIKFH